ncbi:TPA: hypothetical protein ONC65_003380 [Enterobacter hormaechei subsp. xiangfangensis]|nr:hypothetical protein [Enterobacter hormaechei subsp. xiangfangensis]
MKLTYEELEQRLIESERYGRQTDITIDNLEMKLAQMAAENAGLKAALNPEVIPDAAVEAFTETAITHHDWNETSEWSWVENDTDVIRAVLEAIKPETPATDAFLAEVRASAIDNLLSIKTKQLADMHPDTHAFGANAMSIRSQINELQVFAAQLRKGVQS